MPLPSIKSLATQLVQLLRADEKTQVVQWFDRDIDLMSGDNTFPLGTVVGTRERITAVYMPQGWSTRPILSLAVAYKGEGKEAQATAEDSMQDMVKEIVRVALTEQDLGSQVLYVEDVAIEYNSVPDSGLAWAELEITYREDNTP